MQWAICYILVFQHFIICISYLGSVLDWKPCVLPTDWLEWRGSRDHNPPYLTTLYLVFILILIFTLMLILLILAMMEGSSWADSSGKSGSQEASGDAPTSQHSITARALCICSTLYFVFEVLSILYFVFVVLSVFYFVFVILSVFYFVVEVLFLLFCICTTFSFVFCICCNKYSVISTKLDDSVKYIWKTKTASLHGWSRIQKSLLKRMHWNSEQRIFWGKNYLIFELHWNSEPCKVQRRKRAVKILHQQCREFHCRNVNVGQVLKLFWFDIHQ